jgi:RNA polymerase sigma-70 factor (ECF subfamily)
MRPPGSSDPGVEPVVTDRAPLVTKGGSGGPGDPSEETLLETYRAGPTGETGRRAASALFERHLDPLYAWCYRQVRDRERALDLAQETLAAAWQALPRFEGRSRFGTWLFAIARHKCLNAVRTPCREWVHDFGQDDDPPVETPGPEALATMLDEEDQARALFERVLTPIEGAAMWLRCFDGLAVDEITEVLTLGGASGARGVLQTARRKLRAAMECHGEGA